MRIKKGIAGYISARKKRVFVKVLLEFGIVLALFVLGIKQTGDRMNMLTIVAVLGCLPASKAMVEWIMVLPHKSISEEKVAEITGKTGQTTALYDMVFTSEKKIMPVECILLCGKRVIGISEHPKIDKLFTEKHIRQYLSANGLHDCAIKMFGDYGEFLEAVSHISEPNNKETEQKIAQVLLNISL